MLQLVKVQLLGEEIMRFGVDICGLSEVRWDGQGHFTTLDGHTGQVDMWHVRSGSLNSLEGRWSACQI